MASSSTRKRCVLRAVTASYDACCQLIGVILQKAKRAERKKRQAVAAKAEELGLEAPPRKITKVLATTTMTRSLCLSAKTLRPAWLGLCTHSFLESFLYLWMLLSVDH